MSNVTQALEHVVTKSNKLIEASYRLSVAEQRIIAVMASKIAPGDEDFKPYEFKVSDLAELLDTGRKDLHVRLRDTTKGLVGRVLQINEPERLVQVAWLSSATYYDKGKGKVQLCFDPSLRPYLLQLKECFTSVRLKNIVKLRSTYSVRIYELLMQYAAKGEREFKLEELRGMLAIEAGTYKAWQDFQRNVLDLARAELAEHTNLSFTYQPQKGAHGRVLGVVFKFKLKAHERALLRAAKNLGEAGLTKLVKRASDCLESRSGKCDHTWEQHKDEPDAFCHWCSRFNATRNELAGQTRLPGLD